jgi:hypothetical protein
MASAGDSRLVPATFLTEAALAPSPTEEVRDEDMAAVTWCK